MVLTGGRAARIAMVVRAAMAVLAALDLGTGAWALVAPHRWYRTYPGFGHHWLVSQGSFNEHLTADAGAGFLAVGVALAIAALSMRGPAILVAAAALLAHSLPHFLFHLLNPDHQLHGFDVIVGTWGLAAEAAVAVAILVLIPRVRQDPAEQGSSRLVV